MRSPAIPPPKAAGQAKMASDGWGHFFGQAIDQAANSRHPGSAKATPWSAKVRPARRRLRRADDWAVLHSIPCRSQFPYEPGLYNRPGIVPDLYSHAAIGLAPNLVAHQIGKGMRGFLLGRFDMRKLKALFIRGDAVAIANVEKKPCHEA
jgi:hypothetical protein